MKRKSKSNHFTRTFTIVMAIATSATMLGCGGGGGGAAAIVGGVVGGGIVLASIGLSAAPSVGVAAVFVGGRNQKPAVLLPFTSEAYAMAVTPDGKKILITDILHNTVTIMDAKTRKVSAVLDVGTNPRFVAVSPDSQKALVSSFGLEFDDEEKSLPGTLVSLIDVASEQVEAHISVGRKPTAIAFTNDSQKAYVLNSHFDFQATDQPGTVSVIDIATKAVVKTIALTFSGTIAQSPQAIAITREGERAFVVSGRTADSLSGAIAVIDTADDEIVQMIPVGKRAGSLAIDPDDKRLYVSNTGDDTVSVVDISGETAAKVIDIAVGAGPGPLVVSPDGGRVYVANLFGEAGFFACSTQEDPDDGLGVGSTVSVIDTATLQPLPGEIAVGVGPLGMVITEEGTRLYVISGCDTEVTALDTAAIMEESSLSALSPDTVILEARSTAIALSASNQEVYVAHPHAVSFIDTKSNKVRAVVSVRGSGPTQLLTTDPQTSGPFKLYALRPGSNDLAVLRIESDDVAIQPAIPLSGRSSSIAFAPQSNSLFITLSGFSKSTFSSITVDNRVVQVFVNGVDQADQKNDSPILVGQGPIKTALDEENERLFVGSMGHFFNNTREPFGSLTAVDLSDTTNIDTLMDKTEGPAVTDLVIGKINDQKHLFQASFRVDSSSGEIQAWDYGDAQVSVTTVSRDVQLPADLAVGDGRLYAIDYQSADGLTILRGFDLEDAFKEVQLRLPGVNPSKLAIHREAGGRALAFILHAGDRSFYCDSDPNEFCDVGERVSVVDLSTIDQPSADIESFQVGRRPADIAFAADGSKALISSYFDHTVTVVDLDAIDFDGQTPTDMKTLSVGKGPMAILVQGDKAYVANSIGNSISVIAIEEKLADVAVDDTIEL